MIPPPVRQGGGLRPMTPFRLDRVPAYGELEGAPFGVPGQVVG